MEEDLAQEKAHAAFQNAIRLEPEDPEYSFGLGEFLFEQGKSHHDRALVLKAKENIVRASTLNVKKDASLARSIELRLKEIGSYFAVEK